MNITEFKEEALKIKSTFVFNKENEKIFQALLNQTNKGVLIIGGIGTGKTCIMKLFNEVLKNKNIRYFIFADARDISFDFMCKGYAATEKYYKIELSREDSITTKYPNLIIDDLGIENAFINYYGTQEDVISNILFLRHSKKTLTCATTNLSLDMLKKRYGERLFDRFKEMFDIFYLTGKSKRK
jgi:DNA replication protein DnaC